MRLVLDTNVAVSAVLGSGTPARLLELAAEGDIELFISDVLLAELADVLGRAKLATRLGRTRRTVAEVVALYESLADRVVPAAIDRTAADPDDDAVLACALAAGADLIVSGDTDLRNLKSFQRISIVNAADAVARIGARA